MEYDLPNGHIFDGMIPDEAHTYYKITILRTSVQTTTIVQPMPPSPVAHPQTSDNPPIRHNDSATSTCESTGVEEPPNSAQDSHDDMDHEEPLSNVAMDPTLQSPEIASIYRAFVDPKNGLAPGNLQRLSGEQTTASQLLTFLVQTEVKNIRPAYRHHLAQSTIKQQQRTLRWLTKHLPPSDDTLDTAIPLTVGRMAAARTWAPTTWHTKLLNIQGALMTIFIYRPDQVAITMTRCPRWLSSLRTVAHLKPLYRPAQPLAITADQLQQAIASEPNKTVKAALELAWLAAARGGDIRQLLAKDIRTTKDPSRNTETLAITIRRGKTAKKEQYTIGIPLPSKHTMDYINDRKKEGSWAFPGLTGDHIRNALRRVNPKLEQRSLRRGRLQHLSIHENWKDEQLLELSRHASVAMLRRYLDMGIVSATTRETAVRAGPSTVS